MTVIQTEAALEACYPRVSQSAAIVNQSTRVTAHYRALIDASPFLILATSGPRGLDNSPRGDAPGFVRVADDKTLILPDRRGNNRLESLRNILSDPRVALTFLIPASGTTLRVTGRAIISADPALLASFGPRDAPATALIITVDNIFFHCPRSIIKAGLWAPVTWGDPDHLPTPADMLQAASDPRTPARALECA